SHPCQRLIFIGTDIAQIRVLPQAVVEHFDGSTHIAFGCMTGCVLAMPGPLPLEAAKDSLHHRMIQTISLATHTPADAVLREQLLVRGTRILTATVRMMDQPDWGLPPPSSHHQSMLDQRRIDRLTHGPPHD